MIKLPLDNRKNSKEGRKRPSWRTPGGKGLKVTQEGFFGAVRPQMRRTQPHQGVSHSTNYFISHHSFEKSRFTFSGKIT